MSLKQKFRQIKKLPDWVYKPIVWLLLLWRSTLRREIVDESGEVTNPQPPAIGVTWHNRLLFFPLLFPENLRKMTCAVISASRDGQYIADLAGQMGVRSIRGSSRKKATPRSTACLKRSKRKTSSASPPTARAVPATA